MRMDVSGGAGRRRACAALLRRMALAIALLLVASQAAAMRQVDPGEDPKLAPDEGLVVLAVEASAPISSVRIGHAGGSTAEVLNYLAVGRNLRLYATKAGDYEWKQVNVLGWSTRTRFELDEKQYGFKVVAGRISYPGDLVLRPTSWTTLSVHVANHSLPVIDWLEAQHAKLYKALPFTYEGLYPDPFPDYYRTVRAGNTRTAEELNAGREPPKPGTLPITAELMWKANRLVAFGLNPGGDLLAETVRDDNGRYGLELIDLAHGTSQRMTTTREAAGSLMWKDDLTLIARDENGRYTVFHIGPSDGSKRSFKALPIMGRGRLVDLLPGSPGQILFEGFDSRGDLVVHRIGLQGDKVIDSYTTAKSRDRLNVGAVKDMGWYADGHGRLRVAVVMRDDTPVLVHGRDGVFTEVLHPKAEGGFDPAGLSFEGDTIYGFTDDERAQRDLVAFDPATRKVTRTLFTRPGVDVVGMLVDDRREPVAARYYQSGRLVTEYFDSASNQHEKALQGAFPGRTVAVVDRSRDNRQLILWVDGMDHPPQLYHFDATKKRAQLLEDVAPWLSKLDFAPAHIVRATASDGLALEGFLTLPAGNGKRPLVVFPHGGPIGVSDDLHFNREVQFLASQGYAVLQVNFRGSGGYGKAFRTAGEGNYGRLIEDDIDTVLRAALAAYPLDDTRMCTLGSSYGGYSALVSAIRWPGRFRCAISMSGVSDRALFFTASDSVRSEQLRPLMERIMGNPRTDMDEMQARSPLYHTRELNLPVMLVHGRDDMRVDFEHTRRLVRMLNLQNQPPVVLAFADMGHGFDDSTAIDIAWTGIAGFLGTHLGVGSAAPAAATVAGGDAAARSSGTAK